MDENVRKVFERTEQDAEDRREREPSPLVETPFLIPKETSTGVRYVRSRKARGRIAPPGGSIIPVVLAVLTAAAVFTIGLLVMDWGALAGWQLALGLLFPVQVALDTVAVVRTTWPLVKFWVGDLELELSSGRLRFGARCGPLWLGSQCIPVVQIKRLVIVKRVEAKGDASWNLIAEGQDAAAVTLLSADDPGNVVPLAK